MKMTLLFFIVVFMACHPSHQISGLVEASNERPLEGTTWMLAELHGKAISTVEQQRPITVFYQKEGNKVNGFSGCNSFTGSYKLEGTTIVCTPLASTRMFCQEAMETESAFLTLLQTEHTFKMEGAHLLFKDKGTVVARFLPEVKTGN
jgi:heat shock protein HslJ